MRESFISRVIFSGPPCIFLLFYSSKSLINPLDYNELFFIHSEDCYIYSVRNKRNALRSSKTSIYATKIYNDLCICKFNDFAFKFVLTSMVKSCKAVIILIWIINPQMYCMKNRKWWWYFWATHGVFFRTHCTCFPLLWYCCVLSF